MSSKQHTYIFNWFEYNRYGEVLQRKNSIKSTSLYNAIAAFRNAFGNASKNCISLIQEIDENGVNIGTPVTVNPKDFIPNT